MTSIAQKVRNKNPLIHHLTNQVVMNFTANGLLSYGGSPIMAKEPLEMADMASIANGILINIGTLTETDLIAMLIAGKTANENNIPTVLDPVGVAATSFRSESVKKLLENINFTVIKGNAGEMAHLVNVPWATKGVESIDDDLSQLEEIARKVALKYNTIAVVTGEIDIISNGTKHVKNTSGHEFLTKVTGAGCLLGSIIAASIASTSNSFTATIEAVEFYGKASEYAIKNSSVNGAGTFIPHFLDALRNK